MKKIAFVVVWMGSLPNYFPLWLSSCGANNTVDFFLFTDNNNPYGAPSNVKIIYKSFDEVREMIQKHFDFSISLERAYKLCDYKPTYGEVFGDYLVDYDLWGYCDLDLIWGDIRRFVTDEILEQNERIFTRGHCSLFHNNEKVNTYYRTLSPNGHLDYKMVYQSPESWCFDEWAGHCGGGISVIFQDHGIDTYDEPVMADLRVDSGSFYVNRRSDLKKVSYFLHEEGKLYAIGKNSMGKFYEEQMMYVHFQKRKLEIQQDIDSDGFQILPPGEIQKIGQKNGSVQRLVLKQWLDTKYFIRSICRR